MHASTFLRCANFLLIACILERKHTKNVVNNSHHIHCIGVMERKLAISTGCTPCHRCTRTYSCFDVSACVMLCHSRPESRAVRRCWIGKKTPHALPMMTAHTLPLLCVHTLCTLHAFGTFKILVCHRVQPFSCYSLVMVVCVCVCAHVCPLAAMNN